MKFCPECGSDLNGKTKCDTCGYDSVTGEMPKTEPMPNNGIGVAPGPVDPAMQYQEHVKTVTEGIKQAHPEMKMIPLEELKKENINTGDILRIRYTSRDNNKCLIHVIDFEKKKLEESIINFFQNQNLVSTYQMKDDNLEELKQLILDNNFAAWEKISFNGIVPIFGMPTTQLQLFYQKKNVSILSNIFFDDEENDLYSKLILSFDQYKDESMLISKEEKEPDKEFMGFINPKTSDDTLYCPDCGTPYKKGDVCPKCSGYAE
jgi:rubrerythrin